LLTRFCSFTGRSRFTLGARFAGRTLTALAAGLLVYLAAVRLLRIREADQIAEFFVSRLRRLRS
jgi:hypothetical protein